MIWFNNFCKNIKKKNKNKKLTNKNQQKGWNGFAAAENFLKF